MMKQEYILKFIYVCMYFILKGNKKSDYLVTDQYKDLGYFKFKGSF